MTDRLLASLLSCLLLVALAGGCRRLESAADGGSRAETSPTRPPLPHRAEEGGFVDVTLAAGIHVRHALPTRGFDNIVDSLGAGAAFADLDGDGWLDLVVLGGPRSPRGGRWPQDHSGIRLYRNLRDGTFEEITESSRIPPDATAIAVAVADVDGDGDRDLYLVDRGPNRLYRNQGDGVFREVTEEAGVDDVRFGVGAAFFDMDGDRDLDLYVTNYLEFDPRQSAFYAPDGFPGPLTYQAEADVLYENRGGGRFREISAPSGIGSLRGRGMSIATADFDDDGDTDIFVANDATENFLLLNDGSGRFSEVGVQSGVAMGENGEQTGAMAAEVGDVDLDGQLDLVVSDIAYGALYRRIAPALFTDEVMRSGIGPLCGQYVSWGQNLIDFDNDGDLDLFVVNGDLHHLIGWEDLLLRNTGAGFFEDASHEGGAYFARREVGRSSIVGDYDNDGDLDLFITTIQGQHILLRNDSPPTRSWITLDLVGKGVREPFGARVELHANGKFWIAEYRFPSAYLGQSDGRLHFGLGEGAQRVDRIRVTWPDGSSRTLAGVATGQILKIEEATG